MSFSLVIFFLLFIVLAAIFIFHTIENHRLKNYLKKKYGAELVTKISKFFFYQTSALLSAMLVSLVVIVIFYWQLISAQNKLQLLRSLDTIEEKIVSPENTQVSVQNQVQPATNTTLPPAQINNKKEAEKSSIRDVFEAEANSSDNKNAIDHIKSRYEETLITYFFLQKCGKVGDSDYNLIFTALQNEMQQLQAPSRLQYDILTAAKGSYDEVYAKNDCTEANIAPIYQQYNSYIQSLSGKQQ